MHRMSRSRKRFPLLPILLLAPITLLLFRQLPLPGAAALHDTFTLAGAPLSLRHHLMDVMIVPLGAVVVTIFRLTFGLRVLSFFRPILLAIAFRVTGFGMGLLMLALALAVMTAFRPHIRGAYFARVAVSLSLVAVLLLIPVLIGLRVHSALLDGLAYFPLIALCLTCEAFAEVLRKNGLEAALWRTITTVACAAVIVAVSRVPHLFSTLLRFPELLALEAGCILLVDRYLDFRLWNGSNPLRGWLRLAPVARKPKKPRGLAWHAEVCPGDN